MGSEPFAAALLSDLLVHLLVSVQLLDGIAPLFLKPSLLLTMVHSQLLGLASVEAQHLLLQQCFLRRRESEGSLMGYQCTIDGPSWIMIITSFMLKRGKRPVSRLGLIDGHVLRKRVRYECLLINCTTCSLLARGFVSLLYLLHKHFIHVPDVDLLVLLHVHELLVFLVPLLECPLLVEASLVLVTLSAL